MNKIVVFLAVILFAVTAEATKFPFKRLPEEPWAYGSNELTRGKGSQVLETKILSKGPYDNHFEHQVQLGLVDTGETGKVWTVHQVSEQRGINYTWDDVIAAPQSANRLSPPEVFIHNGGYLGLRETIKEADGTAVKVHRKFKHEKSNKGFITQEIVTVKQYPEGPMFINLDQSSVMIGQYSKGINRQGSLYFDGHWGNNVVRVDVNRELTQVEVHTISEVQTYKITEQHYARDRASQLEFELIGTRPAPRNSKLFASEEKKFLVPQQIRANESALEFDVAK